jgi:hypothetical protein
VTDGIVPLPPLPAEAMPEPSEADVADMIGGLIEELDLDPVDIGTQLAVEQRDNGRWAVNDQGSAEWAMRKIAEARIRLDEDTRLYEQFRAQIDQWFRRVAGPHQATIGFFEDHLEDYGRRWIRVQPPSRPKSLPLPSGVIRTTTTGAKPVFVDADVVKAWAVEHEPTLVHEETRTWVLISEVREYVEIVQDIEPNGDGEPVTVWKVVHRVTREEVPGLGIEAEHTTVKVVPETP